MNETKATAMTVKQLAKLYNVDKRTFNEWIAKFTEKIGERIGNIYTPKQVQTIFDHLGEP